MRTMTVATVTKETVPMGVALEMGSNGHVKNRSTIAKPVGQCTGFTYYVTESFLSQKDTTVTINSLYSPLPVRRQEFERNSKREFGKALALLHAYALGPCCSGPGVRLTVSNQMDKGFVVSLTDLIYPLDSFFKAEICADPHHWNTNHSRVHDRTLGSQGIGQHCRS